MEWLLPLSSLLALCVWGHFRISSGELQRLQGCKPATPFKSRQPIGVNLILTKFAVQINSGELPGTVVKNIDFGLRQK